MLTNTQILERVGLNFEIKQAPIQYQTSNGKIIQDDTRMVNYKTDTGERLGIVSDKYEIVPFSESIIPIYHQISKLSEDFDVKTHFSGSKFFTRFTLNSNAVIPYKNNLETAKIVIDTINSFDGSVRFMTMLRTLRMVCTNLAFALRPELKIGGKHMEGMLDMTDLPVIGDAVEEYKKTYIDYYTKLVDKKVTEPHLQAISMSDVIPQHTFGTAIANFRAHKGSNAWELYNEFTFLNTRKKLSENNRLNKDMVLTTIFNKTFLN
jgi:hypothetical protein